jgi:hypothetical protein
MPVPADKPRTGTNSSTHLDGKQIWASLKESVLQNFGDTGWGAVGLSLNGMLVLALSLQSI